MDKIIMFKLAGLVVVCLIAYSIWRNNRGGGCVWGQ